MSIGFNKGGTIDARGIKVTMTTADHSAGDWDNAQGTPRYLGEPAGFVLELEDGSRIYFAGDTNVFGDMRLIRELYAPSLAILPIGGHYTMGPREAALAVELLGVESGHADPLRHLSDPRGHAGPAPRRARRRAISEESRCTHRSPASSFTPVTAARRPRPTLTRASRWPR